MQGAESAGYLHTEWKVRIKYSHTCQNHPDVVYIRIDLAAIILLKNYLNRAINKLDCPME